MNNIHKHVTHIALETGFQSPSYFIKQFKLAKGIPPKQYRKVMLGQDAG
ncbi:helix-turn-helix domain-containing protein [Paenibacillus sp. strain BS8-2]